MKPMLTVEYTCFACGAKNRPVEVVAREEHEDVVAWMRTVQMAVGRDHSTRNCTSLTCDLRIPAPEDSDWIGQAIKQ